MRLLPEEKLEVIKMVTTSHIDVNRTLRELGIHNSICTWRKVSPDFILPPLL